MQLGLTEHMATSMQNFRTTKMRIGKLNMMIQVNEYIVSIQSQL